MIAHKPFFKNDGLSKDISKYPDAALPLKKSNKLIVSQPDGMKRVNVADVDGLVSIYPVAGITHTFTVDSDNLLFEFTNNNPITATIPTNAEQPIDIGTVFECIPTGDGTLTVVGGVGVKMHTNLTTPAVKNEVRRYTKIGTDIWTVEGNTPSESFEYLHFYISGDVPYQSDLNLELFPEIGYRDLGHLKYYENSWNIITSTANDYRGNSMSVFKASNLVGVVVNSSGLTGNLALRVVGYDLGNNNTIVNGRSLAKRTIMQSGAGVRQVIYKSVDINSVDVINPNTFITVTASVKSGVVPISMDRCYISLKFKNL